MNKKISDQVEQLLRKMTLDEKILCCHASGKFATAPIRRLRIPQLVMSDGPHGVREEISKDSWDPVGGEFDYSTYLPPGTALASTWSLECASLFGEVLGSEARERGKDVILGPGVNIARNPLCGRNFEYLGEDPYLNGKFASCVIQAVQKQGTAACVKHFAMNSQEMNRFRVSVQCDERTLREIYLPAFEAAVKSGKVMTIMGAYNKFNGEKCCQNDFLLNQILKKEWGFSGVVISDWNGVTDTFEAARNGMDLEMGTEKPTYSEYYLADPFKKAILNGSVDEAVLDDKVRRYLTLLFKLGMLGGKKRPKGERNTPRHIEIARRIAQEAIVLLKNQRSTLPLNLKKIKNVLIVGENADRCHAHAGGSSGIKTKHEVTPLEGLQNVFDEAGIRCKYIKGYPSNDCGGEFPINCMSYMDTGAGIRGWRCELFRQGSTKADYVFTLGQPCFDFEKDLPDKLKGTPFSGSIYGEFTAPNSGEYTFYCRGISQSFLSINGAIQIPHMQGKQDLSGNRTVTLKKGEVYKIRLPLYLSHGLPLYNLKLTIAKGSPSVKASTSLLAAAKKADAVLFFGGLNHSYDTESADRKDIKLHDGQNELIEQLAGVNSNTVVVLIGGSPVEMPWISKVPAVLQMWYAGQEGGHAIADILTGKVNPSGKLPVTFPQTWEKTPVGANGDYRYDFCNYEEGVLAGYRWFDKHKVKPLFPFGHGLSYTTFSLTAPKLEKPLKGYLAACSFELKNTGKRAGAEVVQLYVEPPAIPGILRPVRELKGFAKEYLEAGGSCRICFYLDARAFSYFDPVKHKWTIAPGTYTLRCGTSSANLEQGIKIKL